MMALISAALKWSLQLLHLDILYLSMAIILKYLTNCDELELNQHNDLFFLYTVQIFPKSMNHMQISVALTGKKKKGRRKL